MERGGRGAAFENGRAACQNGCTACLALGTSLERLEKMSEPVLAELTKEVPPAWYDDDYDALLQLLEQIHRSCSTWRGDRIASRFRTG